MTSSTATAAPAGRGWRIGFWVAQVMLAFAFGMAGVLKGFTPMPELGEKIFWAKDVPLALTRFIGLSELAAAIAMILPAATRIKPSLTGIAAAALVGVMVLAIGFHVVRGEAAFITGPIVLGTLAAFVAWGRLKKAPITPR